MAGVLEPFQFDARTRDSAHMERPARPASYPPGFPSGRFGGCSRLRSQPGSPWPVSSHAREMFGRQDVCLRGIRSQTVPLLPWSPRISAPMYPPGTPFPTPLAPQQPKSLPAPENLRISQACSDLPSPCVLGANTPPCTRWRLGTANPNHRRIESTASVQPRIHLPALPHR